MASLQITDWGKGITESAAFAEDLQGRERELTRLGESETRVIMYLIEHIRVYLVTEQGQGTPHVSDVELAEFYLNHLDQINLILERCLGRTIQLKPRS